MKFSVCNLGCKVNAYEAESISETLIKKGWQRVNSDEEADAILIFTCAVTNTASSKSRKALHAYKRQSPKAIMVVAGCYAQLDDGLLDEADILVGTAHKKDIPIYLDQYLEHHHKIKVIDDLKEVSFDNLLEDHFQNHTRGVLRIQDGCNQFCSYCIIPYARGKERSMEPDLVVEQAKKMSKNHNEIVLTGIHTGRYGREYNVSLASIMKRILKEVPSLKRLRISSIEITEISDELIELMKNDTRIARHLHIPLQAGSDSVLKNMRRPYDTKYYFDRITKIRKEIPDISISCDIMVGFPNESDEDFLDSYHFLKKCEFTFLHVFPFSVRKGTVAEKMPCQINGTIKKNRSEKCLALSKELMDNYQEKWLNREVEVMCEKKKDGYIPGYTSQYMPIRINGDYPRGTMLRVRCTKYEDHIMYGEVVGEL